MSFVHCSSCHRAYDLRRSASCPSCRQKAEAAAKVEAAKLEAAKLEAAKLEAARLEAAKLEAAKLEAAKLEAAQLEAAQLEAAKLEAAAPSAHVSDEAELVEDVAAEAVEIGPQASASADELTAYRAAPREDRIVAMVEELAALLESASTVELEAAQRQLHQRGLRAPWTAQLGSGGRFLLAAGSQLVTSAIRAPQQGARKLARRLRDAWSGNNLRA